MGDGTEIDGSSANLFTFHSGHLMETVESANPTNQKSYPDGFQCLCRVKINAGDRAMAHIPFELEALDARKPLVIAGENVRTGRLLKAFRNADMTVGIFDRMPKKPDPAIARQAGNRCQQSTVAADGTRLGL